MSTRHHHQHQPEWTPLSTKLLANLILDQVRKGNTVNNNSSLSNKAWNFITNEFHTRSGIKHDKEHLKNRFSLLAREFSVVKLILSRDNFVFDESTGCIIATDESWDQYVKECPEAEAVRSGGCPVYTQLSQIFGVVHLLEEEETVLLPPQCSPKRRPSRGVEAAIANAIGEMAAASRVRTSSLTEVRSRFSLAECIRELDGIKGVAENVYFAALEIFNNASARETFLSLKSHLRLPWLQWKCNAVSPTA
ncbi:Myb/SANT-like domain-containing protein [Hirschfeldia incana]|nr:Myb/SANT-like domain-containing protein [Hirschfeldia incana]